MAFLHTLENGDPGPAPLFIPRAGSGWNGGQTLDRQFVLEVAPMRIMALDKLELPGTPPFLDPLFSQDRICHGLVKFGKD